MIEKTEKEPIKKKLFCSAVLLAMLFASAAYGSREMDVAQNAVSVMSVQMDQQEFSRIGLQKTREKLYTQREKELQLLEEVIRSTDAEIQTKQDALLQKTDIVRRMEYETQAAACLENMGMKECVALYGTQNMTVFAPFEYVSDERNRTMIIDSLSSLTGLGPESIKIILTKK